MPAGRGTVCNVPTATASSESVTVAGRSGWPGTDAPGSESTPESVAGADTSEEAAKVLWLASRAVARRPPRRHRDCACEEAAKVLWSPLHAVTVTVPVKRQPKYFGRLFTQC